MFHLRREVDGQPLGIVLGGGESADPAEIREILPGSPASQQGMSANKVSERGRKIKSNIETKTCFLQSKVRDPSQPPPVSWAITEVNGRPLSLLAKESEAGERLQALGRDISVLVQPVDFVHKMRKQLKTIRGYKDYVMS